MDLTTATPVEIDTILADLYDKAWDAREKLATSRQDLHSAAGDKRRYVGKRRGWFMTYEEAEAAARQRAETDTSHLGQDASRALQRVADRLAALTALNEEMEPYHAEYHRRPWNRAFLALSDNGHVHNGMNCSTCHHGEFLTRLEWQPKYSGAPEATIVESAGERACTVCYPSAPVEALSRPTTMFSKNEVQKKLAREERERKAAERAASKTSKAITAPDGSRLYGEGPRDWIDTEAEAQRIAVNLLADNEKYAHQDRVLAVDPDLAWMYRAADHRARLAEEHTATADRLAEALAHKRGLTKDEVLTDLRKKAVAKHQRDWREMVKDQRFKHSYDGVAYAQAKKAKREEPWVALTETK